MTKWEKFSHIIVGSVMKSALKILFIILLIIFLTYCFILPVNCLKDNVCMKSVKFLHSLLDKGINKKEEGQLIICNCTTERGTLTNKQNVANNKSNNSNISNILDHTANILSKTGILLTAFSVFVIIASLLTVFLGFKWIREHHIVEQNIQRLKENSLDNLLTIAVSIPLLSYTHIIPSGYFETIKHIHERVESEEYRYIIDKDPKYAKLKLINSMHYWIKGEYKKSLSILEDITYG